MRNLNNNTGFAVRGMVRRLGGYRGHIASIVAVLGLTIATPAWADFQSGVEAWEKGDFRRAVVEWRPLAVAGNAEAQFNLAQAYKLNRGIEANLEEQERLQKAVHWYRRAAEQNYTRAEDNLGLVLFVMNRRAEALPYLKRAANRGDERALYVLGTVLYNGIVEARDFPRAYAYMTRSSALGFAPAKRRLQEFERKIPARERQQGLTILADLQSGNAEISEQALSTVATAASRPSPPPTPAETPPTGTAVRTSFAATPVVASAVPSSAPPPAPPAPPRAAPTASSTPSPPAAAPPQAVARQQPPAPPPAKATAAPPRPSQASTIWRVQFGAFSNRQRASALQRKLRADHSSLARRSFHLVESGALVRLQVGDFGSRRDAIALCEEMKSKNQDCLVVKRNP